MCMWLNQITSPLSSPHSSRDSKFMLPESSMAEQKTEATESHVCSLPG